MRTAKVINTEDAQTVTLPEDSLCYLDSPTLAGMTDDEKIDFVAARILKKYKPAFIDLANE